MVKIVIRIPVMPHFSRVIAFLLMNILFLLSEFHYILEGYVSSVNWYIFKPATHQPQVGTRLVS